MKEEIKEILDKLNEDKDYDDYVDYKGSYFKPLLDYITNLQEENKRFEKAKEILLQDRKNATDLFIAFKQRIDKAIEYIENEYEENIIITDYADNPITPQELYGDLLNILKGDKDD